MAAKVEVTKVTDLGGDVLEVQGVVAGDEVVARGWVSAMERFYPDDRRDDDGNRISKRKPRKMTQKERRAYWESLLVDAAPKARVLFEA